MVVPSARPPWGGSIVEADRGPRSLGRRAVGRRWGDLRRASSVTRGSAEELAGQDSDAGGNLAKQSEAAAAGSSLDFARLAAGYGTVANPNRGVRSCPSGPPSGLGEKSGNPCRTGARLPELDTGAMARARSPGSRSAPPTQASRLDPAIGVRSVHQGRIPFLSEIGLSPGRLGTGRGCCKRRGDSTAGRMSRDAGDDCKSCPRAGSGRHLGRTGRQQCVASGAVRGGGRERRPHRGAAQRRLGRGWGTNNPGSSTSRWPRTGTRWRGSDRPACRQRRTALRS
jgi:hypothetical protein